ncbi:MAG: ATP-binding cassette domain-containing protein [Flavobacteriaceae bacterium]|nr:ATP-binding cassette domain-containing protein [Flavobacteriaceae bacterium]
MIKVENLCKSFDGVEILKNISTCFDEGKTNLIIGSSGSGKTVFLKCMLGLYKPDSGIITFDGLTYSEADYESQMTLRTKIGMVFQGSALFDSMSVAGNVMFPLNMFSKMNKAEMKERVDQVLERVNLQDAQHKLPSQISGGMQKRVAIARSIVLNPKYLFCDEPNSGLDPKTSIMIDNLIQEITREYNITTVINSHDMNSVMEIGEKIILLKGGEKAWEGTNKEIFKTDNKAVTDFVYSSNLMKKVREVYRREN